jgi:hypothetical protein
VCANGRIVQVYCTIYTDIEEREKLLVPKIDSLYKHASKKRAIVDMWKVQPGLSVGRAARPPGMPDRPPRPPNNGQTGID